MQRFRPEALLHPRTVAVIGEAPALWANLQAGDFQGALMQAADAPAVAALPQAPDLAIIGDGLDLPATFAALGARGCFAAIVPGMATRLHDLAEATGVRALGPGSFGLVIPGLGLNASAAPLAPSPGRVALVSQSAALCRAVLDWAGPNGVGFSHVVGIGGNHDLGFAVVLDWLSRDPGTGAILLDIRRIRDPRRFLSAARAAARLRPVLAIRAGGLLLDPSGAADQAFAAALRRAGVLGVNRLEDLLAAAETLTRARPARGEALAIVSNAIGPAQLAADAALRDGHGLAVLRPETRAVLSLTLPTAFDRRDTLDLGDIVYTGADQPIRLAETAALLAGAAEVSGVLLVHAPTGAADAAAMQAIEAASQRLRVPLLACVMGETTGAAHRRLLAQAGVPAFATPEQAVRGFLHLVQDRRNRAAARELPSSAVLDLTPDHAAVRRAFADAPAGPLPPGPVEAVFAAYGIAAAARIAVRDDPVFGPIIRLAPPHRAAVVDLPPLNLTLAHALLRQAELDDDAAAEALVRISQLLVDFPRILALDLGPPAALVLRPPGERGRLALPPYPAELTERFQAGPDRLTIRPIRPEDAEAHAALFARVPPEDIRYRFFSAMRELSAEQTARLTQIDYEREMAFVAIRDPGETVGVARLVRDGGPDSAEFAILVQPDMKGRGLAGHLMRRLIAWGESQGIAEITGQILADNRAMLGFIAGLGFRLSRVPGEADLVQARLALSPRSPA